MELPSVSEEDETKFLQEDKHMEETLLLKKELNELTNLLQQNEKNRVMERQIFKEKEKQHIRDVEELKRQVNQCQSENIELKVQLETLSIANSNHGSLSELPPVNVSQLEAKVTELQNQNEEYKLSHEEEIQRLVGECDEKSQKTAAMMVMNALLKSQLSEMEERIGTINKELVECRKQMQQELIAKEMENESKCACDCNVVTLQEENDKLSQEVYALHNKIKQIEKQHCDVEKKKNQEIMLLEFSKDEELINQARLNEELRAKNAELYLQMEQQGFKLESTTAEITLLKQGVELVIAMLSQEDMVAREQLPESSEELAIKVVSITEQWLASTREKQENDTVNSVAGSMMKKTIESLQGRIESLQEANDAMEVQIEEIDNQKKVTERKLVLSESSVKQREKEMEKLHDLKQQIEKKLQNVEKEANTFRQKENEAESALRKRALVIKSLEQQLQSSQDEIMVLQKSISRLNAEKTECNNQLNDIKLQIKSSESEKQAIQQEMASTQELNKSLLVNVIELQKANSVLEVEKRSLGEALSNASSTKVLLNMEKDELAKQQMADRDELLQIQTTNKQLNFKIEELDKNLSELELTCKVLKNEKEELSQEASVLNDAVTNLRRALSEVQIQRGKLSQSIAKVAQENGELIQVKLQLTSEKTLLQATSNSITEKLNSVVSDNSQLKSQNASLESKLVEAEKEIESLTQKNLMLQTQKQQMLEDQSKAIESKNEAISQILAKHNKELEKLSTEASTKQMELQKCLAIEKGTHTQQMANMKNTYEGKIASLQQELIKIKEERKSELAVMEEKHKDEVAKLRNDKESHVKNSERNLEIMVKNFENQKMVLESKVEDLEYTKRNAESTIIKMKAERSVNQNTIDELGSQISSNEKELKQLQQSLDDIKSNAQRHVDDLQSELLEANTTAREFEHKYDTANEAIKHLQESRNCFQSMLEEAQSSLDQLQQERDTLLAEKRNLQKQSEDKASLLTDMNDNMASLKMLNAKLEQEGNAAKEKCAEIRQSLLLAEGSLATLSSEHQQLQDLVVHCHTEANSSKARFTACRAENDNLLSRLKVSEALADQLKAEVAMVTDAHEAKLSELESLREILKSVKDEKEGLQLSFIQLEEMSLTQAQDYASKIVALKKTVEEIKEKNNELIKEMTTCEMKQSESESKAKELQSECDELKREVSAREDMLGKATKLQQSAQAAYDALADVLTGCFNDSFTDGSQKAKSSKILDTYKVHQAIRALQAATLELKNANMQLTEENKALRTSSTHFNTTQHSLESEKSKLESAKSLLQAKVNELMKEKLQTEEIVGKKDEEIIQLREQVLGFESQLKDIKMELDNCNVTAQAQAAHVSSISQELLENEVAKTKAIARLKQIQVALQAYEEKNKELKESLKDMASEISNNKDELCQLKEENQSLQSALDSSESLNVNLRKETRELGKSIGNSAVTVSNLELRLQKQEEMNMELHAENQSVKSAIDDVTNKLQVSQDNERILVTKVMAVKQEKEKVTENLTTSLLESKSIIDEMNCKAKQLEYTSASLKDSIRNLRSEKLLLEEQLRHYKYSEKSLRERMAKVEKETNSTKMINEEVCKRLRKENGSLQNSLKEAENKLMQLEEELKVALEHGQAVQESLMKHTQQTAELTKNNSELKTVIKSIEESANEVDKKRIQEVEAQRQQVKLVQAEMEFLKNIWKAEEEGLKESIEEQERKILMLEDQLHQGGCHDNTPMTHGICTKIINKQRKANKGRYGSTGEDDPAMSSDNNY